MDIFELADKMGRELVIRRLADSTKLFYCRFDGASLIVRKNMRIIGSPIGSGKTIKESIRDYIRQIKGRNIIFRADDPESEIGWSVPKDLRVPKKM